MPEEPKKSSLFSDLSEHLFVIIGGILSLTTFIPIFLNSVTEILGLEHIRFSYYLFVLIYFVLPYIAYCISAYSRSRFPYERLIPVWNNRQEMLVIPIGLLYLLLPLGWIDIVLFVYFAVVGIYFAWITCRSLRYAPIFRYECIVVLTVLLAVGISVCLPGIKKVANFSLGAQSAAFDAFEVRDKLGKDFIRLADSARKESWSYRMQAIVVKPKLTMADWQKPCINCPVEPYYQQLKLIEGQVLSGKLLTIDNQKLRKIIKNLLAHDANLVKNPKISLVPIITIDDACSALYDYAVSIQRVKISAITAQWTSLLTGLRFKSICWLFTLLVVGTIRWYSLNHHFSDSRSLQNKSAAATIRQENMNRLKAFLLILVILITPWFRPVDVSSVDLSRPFINLTLGNLVTGGNHIDPITPVIQPPHGSDTAHKVPIIINGPTHMTDTVRIIDTVHFVFDSLRAKGPDSNFYKWFIKIAAPRLHDSMLDTIKSDVRKNQQLIKRTIANPADRN